LDAINRDNFSVDNLEAFEMSVSKMKLY